MILSCKIGHIYITYKRELIISRLLYSKLTTTKQWTNKIRSNFVKTLHSESGALFASIEIQAPIDILMNIIDLFFNVWISSRKLKSKKAFICCKN